MESSISVSSAIVKRVLNSETQNDDPAAIGESGICSKTYCREEENDHETG